MKHAKKMACHCLKCFLDSATKEYAYGMSRQLLVFRCRLTLETKGVTIEEAYGMYRQPLVFCCNLKLETKVLTSRKQSHM